LRRELAKEARESNVDEIYAKGVVLLAKEMSWELDYVLKMDIVRFNTVSRIIKEFYEEQSKAMEVRKQRTTFG